MRHLKGRLGIVLVGISSLVGPELSWDLWGEEGQLTERLHASGAKVRGVSPLRLEEAAVSILAGREPI